MNQKLIFIILLFFFVNNTFSQGENIYLLEKCNHLSNKQITLIINQIDNGLSTNIEKTEAISNLLYKSLNENPRVFLKRANKLRQENKEVLLKIIENPLSDTYNINEIIERLKKLKLKNKFKNSLIESLKKAENY